jgi:hypothetical protein
MPCTEVTRAGDAVDAGSYPSRRSAVGAVHRLVTEVGPRQEHRADGPYPGVAPCQAAGLARRRLGAGTGLLCTVGVDKRPEKPQCAGCATASAGTMIQSEDARPPCIFHQTFPAALGAMGAHAAAPQESSWPPGAVRFS